MEPFFAQWDIDIDEPSKDKLELYNALQNKMKEQPENVELFWRLVQAALVLASSQKKVNDKTNGKKYTEEALMYAKSAVMIEPNSLQAHKWYCAAVGRMAGYASMNDRIKFGHEFKEHRDLAVAIDSNDRLLHYMYGRWCFEIASLSWIERQVAATFFTVVPKATYDDALSSFQTADSLKHDWKSNHCFLAKTYVAMKKFSHAIKWIDSGLAFPVQTEEDAVMENELKMLEKSYSKYR